MAATKELPAKGAKPLDARGAAQAAFNYFTALYPSVKAYSLEEIEQTEDGEHWLITLGFDTDAKANGWALMPPKTKFKVFKVNIQTGEVVSMKIRKLE